MYFPPPASPAVPLPVIEAEIAPERRSRRRSQTSTVEQLRRELRPRRAPDAFTIEKSRGRLEMREVWVVEADELSEYLAEEWGWQGVSQIGWLRRWRKRRPSELWSVEEVTIVTSRSPATTSPRMILTLAREHWSIEKRVHWVRDLSFHEDRLHGRQIGGMLAWLRNMTINLIRRVWPQTLIPDAWSRLSADRWIALRWLLLPLMN